MSCDPTSPNNSKWPTDEAVEFPATVLQCNTRQVRPSLVRTSTPRLHPPPPPPSLPYTPPIPTHVHIPCDCAAVSPNVKCKRIKDSLGIWIPRRGFRILGTGLRIFCQWNVDFRFQSLVGFRTP